jgi:hypothetical protein
MSFSGDPSQISLLDRFSRFVPAWMKTQAAVGIIVGIVAFAGLYSVLPPHRPLRPVVNAPAYIWPKGCPDLNYEHEASRGENISCACASENNHIRNWLQHGLRDNARGNDEWYRVGHYAIDIAENDGIFSGKECRIRDIQPMFFIENLNKREKI